VLLEEIPCDLGGGERGTRSGNTFGEWGGIREERETSWHLVQTEDIMGFASVAKAE